MSESQEPDQNTERVFVYDPPVHDPEDMGCPRHYDPKGDCWCEEEKLNDAQLAEKHAGHFHFVLTPPEGDPRSDRFCPVCRTRITKIFMCTARGNEDGAVLLDPCEHETDIALIFEPKEGEPDA